MTGRMTEWSSGCRERVSLLRRVYSLGRSMFVWRTVGILSAVFLLLEGCATLSKNECLQAQWYDIGFTDGAGGHTLTRIGKPRKACAAGMSITE